MRDCNEYTSCPDAARDCGEYTDLDAARDHNECIDRPDAARDCHDCLDADGVVDINPDADSSRRDHLADCVACDGGTESDDGMTKLVQGVTNLSRWFSEPPIIFDNNAFSNSARIAHFYFSS